MIFLFLFILALEIYGDSIITDKWVLKQKQDQIPVLIHKENNLILQMDLIPASNDESVVEEVQINLKGTTNMDDIETVRLFYSENGRFETENQFGADKAPASEITFSDQLVVSGPVTFWVSVELNKGIDLQHKIRVSGNQIILDSGLVIPEIFSAKTLRVGIALRQHMDDNVHTYRIPGLTTTNTGTLLAVYDARREMSRDLQGDIDIGLNRSTDGGDTWEPMQVVLDMGEWGDLPRKFNGVSDANVLVDRNTNTIFVAGLWMHGVLDEDGKWIEGLTENSDVWEHQWRQRGSQPGFGIKETSQFLITKSTDDGRTWSEPVNLTETVKKKEWWLWAPAPGSGITLEDGTLVIPTQGRDENGGSFSNITWSKDGGKSWNTSNPASRNTTESKAVQLSDGSIMLNMRHNSNRSDTTDSNGRAISVTRDLGETWVEHPTSRGALIEPTCMASLLRHEYSEKGRAKSILLFANPNSKTERKNMTIKVSFDDGMTWPEEYWLLLDEHRSRGYSSLTSIDENTIGILYEGSQSDMTFEKISLSELLKQ